MRKTVKRTIRRIVNAAPGGQAALRKRHYYLEHRRLARIGSAQAVFEHHYVENAWGSTESVSGPGSEIAYTENIRAAIPRLARERDVKTILDAPCGDYHWFKLISFEPNVSYIGGDIVPSLIARNIEQFEDQRTTFKCLDVVHDRLPAADLWLCRDCFMHLSNRDIRLALDNFLASDIRYLLASTHSECETNLNLPTGSFRLVNLQLPPFSLGEPLTLIDDWVEGHPVRHLALWDKDAVRARHDN